MQRALALACGAALLVGCATQRDATVVVRAERHCAKHRVPLITVHGYKANSGTLVHTSEPRSVPCTVRSPNRIWDRHSFTRDDLRPVPGLVTYCVRCAAEFWQCEGGDHQLSDDDRRQITTLVSSLRGFRRPLIRVFPIYEHHAVAIGGDESHVGGVFTDVRVVRRHGRWMMSGPVDTRRIIAVGRPPSI